ncbi:MAG: alpha/beta hydrolase [Candidatus Paceibacterota bacterium]|jgi:pimeloyl-ACP methyl ester carboxylesterase
MAKLSIYQDYQIQTKTGLFAVRDYGHNGSDVLLVHGTGHNLEVWEPLAAVLRDKFHIVAFDMRGHGQTPEDSKDPDQYWKDIGAMITALKLRSPILVGHSAGGYAVTAHAAADGKCRAVVVLDGFVLDPRDSSDETHAWSMPEHDLWDKFRYGWRTDGDTMTKYVDDVCESAPSDWLNSGINSKLVRTFTSRSFYRKEDAWHRRPSLEEIHLVRYPDPKKEIFPSVDIYDRVRVPMGLVYAANGLYKGRRADIKALAEKRKNRIFKEVDAGHNIHMQRPVEVSVVIKDIHNRY